MSAAQTSGAAAGALAGAKAGSVIGPWGTAIGGIVGGAIGFFGSKSPKAPTAAPFTPVNVQDEQQKAIAGNLANFKDASTLAGKTNDFNSSESLRLIEQAIPGFAATQKRLLAQVNSDLNGDTNLPQDVQDKLSQLAAEKGISRGTSGGFNSFNLVKDFGFNLVDWKNASRARALNTLSTVYGMAPKVNIMSPMASMVDPGTAINAAAANNSQRYNVDQSLINAQTRFGNDQAAQQNGALSGFLSSLGGLYGSDQGPGAAQAKVNAPASLSRTGPGFAATIPSYGK